MNSKVLSLVPICLVAVACNGGSGKSDGYVPEVVQVLTAPPYEPGQEELLFPMKVGNQWTYEVEAQTTLAGAASPTQVKSMLTLRCTNVVRVGDQVRGTIEAVLNDKVNERQVWVLDKKGLYQTSVGLPEQPYNPRMPVFRAPLKKDDVIVWEGTGFVSDGTMSQHKAEIKCLGPMEADTGLGRVNAVAVQSIVTWKKGKSGSTTWFAPKIGIVRWRQEVVTANGTGIQVMRLVRKSIVE